MKKRAALLFALLSGLIVCSKTENLNRSRLGWLSPTRGYILISIDTLRADHLGCYGYSRDTSPFLDKLAAKSTLFEHAVVQYPSTLTSHLSIFTGLYPEQHGVYAPYGVLSTEIPTLPELMQKSGFRTFGYSEGGYVAGRYGFRRGFEEWNDKEYASDSDAEITFQRGILSLKKLRPNDRFFLFLHTYSVHDPYEPPKPFRGYFWQGEPPPDTPPSWGKNLGSYNSSALSLTKQSVEYYMARYDESIRYVDHVINDFFADLKRLGLDQETTVIITSDHGEEFLEHERLAHSQLYEECLRVPLIVIHPKQSSAQRVKSLVQSIDLAPTLLELSGVKKPEHISGHSLIPILAGSKNQIASEAYASFQDTSSRSKTIYQRKGSNLLKFLENESFQGDDTFWVVKSIEFDVRPPHAEFSAYSYVQERTVSVKIDGTYLTQIQLNPEKWQTYRIDLPKDRSKYSMKLTGHGCLSPASRGNLTDARCLSFQLQGQKLDQTRLFDLNADPKELLDLSAEKQDTAIHLRQQLNSYNFNILHDPSRITLTREQQEHLMALGYIQ